MTPPAIPPRHDYTIIIEFPDATTQLFTCTGRTTIHDLRLDTPMEGTEHVAILEDDTGYDHRVEDLELIADYLAEKGRLRFVDP